VYRVWALTGWVGASQYIGLLGGWVRGWQELLDAIVDAREQGGRIDDQLLTRLLRDRLHSKPCQNQGFVLDGYPKTIDQAKELFSGTTAYIYCGTLQRPLQPTHRRPFNGPLSGLPG